MILFREDGCLSPDMMNRGGERATLESTINGTKEALMVEVTAEATKQGAEFFKGRDVKPIRIFLNDGG